MNKFVRSFFGRIRGHQIFLSDYLTFILFKYCEMWCHHESQYCFDSSHFDFDFYCVPTSEFLVFSRLCFHEKNRFEIAHKICSHWLMTLKSLDGFCHASKHFFNENCKKGKFPYRLFCCKTMTKTTMQSLLPDSTFDIRVLVKSNC